MNSRMERYSKADEMILSGSRVNKNQALYSDINNLSLSRVKANNNYRVIDDVSKEIDIEKIKKYIDSLTDKEEERKRITINRVPQDDEQITEKAKIYDINSIIEEAKSKKEKSYEEEKYKKLSNTEFDILKNIKMYEKPTEEIGQEISKSEKTLIDLINTLAINKKELDLLSELTEGTENTVVTKPIEEELKESDLKGQSETEKTNVKIEAIPENKNNDKNKLGNIDKTFYTNSMSFSKQDFEGLDELEKEAGKTSLAIKISIVFLVLVVIATLVVIANYVFNLGLF